MMVSDSEPRRWTSFEFPAYTYVPGKFPHPTREENGHSYGRPEPHVENFDAEHWQECSAFLFGIDLFNAGFYWESHEQWEAVWNALARTGTEADFIKGLIKLAAAKVKFLEGRPVGVQRHARRAAELFESVGQEFSTLCGMDVAALCKEAQTLESDLEKPLKLAPESDQVE